MAVLAARVGVDFPALKTAVVKTAIVDVIFVVVVLEIDQPKPVEVVFEIVDTIGDCCTLWARIYRLWLFATFIVVNVVRQNIDNFARILLLISLSTNAKQQTTNEEHKTAETCFSRKHYFYHSRRVPCIGAREGTSPKP